MKELKTEIDTKSGGIVFSQILEEDLPRYQQAAELSGFEVVVDAKEGETWKFFYDGGEYISTRVYNKPGWRSTVIGEGRCGIRIIAPEGNIDHSSFWQRLE